MLLILAHLIETAQVYASANMNNAARAIATGDVNSFKSILKRSQAVVKTRDNYERTLLHYCADRSLIPDRLWIGRKSESHEKDHKKLADKKQGDG